MGGSLGSNAHESCADAIRSNLKCDSSLSDIKAILSMLDRKSAVQSPGSAQHEGSAGQVKINVINWNAGSFQ